jgi:hypothetical protein
VGVGEAAGCTKVWERQGGDLGQLQIVRHPIPHPCRCGLPSQRLMGGRKITTLIDFPLDGLDLGAVAGSVVLPIRLSAGT